LSWGFNLFGYCWPRMSWGGKLISPVSVKAGLLGMISWFNCIFWVMAEFESPTFPLTSFRLTSTFPLTSTSNLRPFPFQHRQRQRNCVCMFLCNITLHMILIYHVWSIWSPRKWWKVKNWSLCWLLDPFSWYGCMILVVN
jgi:hypothetical protein